MTLSGHIICACGSTRKEKGIYHGTLKTSKKAQPEDKHYYYVGNYELVCLATELKPYRPMAA